MYIYKKIQKLEDRDPKFIKGDLVKITDLEFPVYIEMPLFDDNGSFTGEYQCSRSNDLNFTELHVIHQDVMVLFDKDVDTTL